MTGTRSALAWPAISTRVAIVAESGGARVLLVQAAGANCKSNGCVIRISPRSYQWHGSRRWQRSAFAHGLCGSVATAWPTGAGLTSSCLDSGFDPSCGECVTRGWQCTACFADRLDHRVRLPRHRDVHAGLVLGGRRISTRHARADRGHLRLCLGGTEQRPVAGLTAGYDLVQRDSRAGGDRAFRAHRAGARHRRLPGPVRACMRAPEPLSAPPGRRSSSSCSA